MSHCSEKIDLIKIRKIPDSIYTTVYMWKPSGDYVACLRTDMASVKNNMRTTNKNTLLKVVILGDGGVGKSCLMNRFVSNQFDEHSFHTIGVEFLNKDVEIDGETYTLQVSKNCFNFCGKKVIIFLNYIVNSD